MLIDPCWHQFLSPNNAVLSAVICHGGCHFKYSRGVLTLYFLLQMDIEVLKRAPKLHAINQKISEQLHDV